MERHMSPIPTRECPNCGRQYAAASPGCPRCPLGARNMGSRLIRAIQRLWVGYDPTTTFECDGCHQKFTGRRFVVPPLRRYPNGPMWNTLCIPCSKGRHWTPPDGGGWDAGAF